MVGTPDHGKSILRRVLEKQIKQSEPKPEDIFVENEHGWWCPHCGDLIRSAHSVFDPDDEPDPPLPDECRHCGFPEVSEEWIEANT